MFHVQLGPVMVDFNDQVASFVSLGRALFGDFSIDEVLDNDTGYLNAILFLMFMFVAVFIMLSMSFAGAHTLPHECPDSPRLSTVHAPAHCGWHACNMVR